MIDQYCPNCGSRMWKNGYVYLKKESKNILRYKCKNIQCRKKIMSNKAVEHLRCESCSGKGYI